jgi:hypothetical protein
MHREVSMNNILLGLAMILIIAIAIVIGVHVLRRRPASVVTIHSSIRHLRSIGQLSVFKVITKEIVTETDHSWGEFGTKYLTWVLSKKKMAMIFEFAIDFRYDLRRPEFEIIGDDDTTYTIKMPPCFHEAHIRDIQFYDEQRSKFLPWLLPDLLSGFLSDGFSEEHRNKLVAAAKAHAEQQARELIENLESEVQSSAKATLQSISKAFGAHNVAFEFSKSEEIDLNIGYAKKVTD